MLLFLLAGVWVAFLLPPYFRKRSERSANSILSFRRQLSTLARTTPRSRTGLVAVTFGAASRGPLPARRLRPRSDAAGPGAVGATSSSPSPGPPPSPCCWPSPWEASPSSSKVLADVLLAGYLYLLVRVRKSEADRAAKVRYLPGATVAPEPALLMRRSASN